MEQTLRRKIEIFLTASGMPPSVFGRRAMHDPRFVFDLRNGREPGTKARRRAEHFMNIWKRDGSPPYVARPRGRPS